MHHDFVIVSLEAHIINYRVVHIKAATGIIISYIIFPQPVCVWVMLDSTEQGVSYCGGVC